MNTLVASSSRHFASVLAGALLLTAPLARAQERPAVPPPPPGAATVAQLSGRQRFADLRRLVEIEAVDQRRMRYLSGGLQVAVGVATTIAGAYVLSRGNLDSVQAGIGGAVLGLGLGLGLTSPLTLALPTPIERVARGAASTARDQTLSDEDRALVLERTLSTVATDEEHMRMLTGALNLVATGVDVGLAITYGVAPWMVPTNRWVMPATFGVLAVVNVTVGVVQLAIARGPAERVLRTYRALGRMARVQLPTVQPFVVASADGALVGAAGQF